jgi:predicted nucleotidyltransferase
LTDLESGLRSFLADLTGTQFALVGGLAVSIRAEPRLTRDVDIAVSVDSDEQAQDIVLALQQIGYETVLVVEQDATNRLATVRLIHPGHPGILLDLLFASSGIEPEVVAGAESLEILPDLTAPVSRTGHLIALKLLARDDRQRPNDHDDLMRLLEVATKEDIARANEAVALITARGYNRGRDLLGSLTELTTPTQA